jgi:hypothetical protein
MEKEFVPYDHALKLKQLGFDEPCFSFYMGGFKELGKIKYVNPNNVAETNVLAPTFSQAFRWFRENYLWTIKINQVTKNNWSYTLDNFQKDRIYYGDLYETFELAEIACLEKLIEFIEREK